MNRIYIILSFLLFGISINGQICPDTTKQGQIDWFIWQDLRDDQVGDLTTLPTYPHHPTLKQTRFKVQQPQNFDDMYGSLMRGFIKVDAATTATFNLTADYRARFYLSTDDTKANLQLQAYVDDYTGYEEHGKFPTQTTSSITLQPGQYYYFEVVLLEGRWSDHCTVWWQTPLVDANNWNVLGGDFIYGVGCEDNICPPPGTLCDDGDLTTEDDIEDGNCNCFGSKIVQNGCIGDRSKVVRYQYDGISGGGLDDLYEAANFPAIPTFSEVLPTIGHARKDIDNIGTMVQGYITVPVTGGYKFNVTGDDQTIFFLSSDDQPENKQAHQVLVSGTAYEFEHDKYIYQSTSFIQLEAGKYYYYEVNNKQGGWIQHFNVYWQTPFTPTGQWKQIPSLYTHHYDCTEACIPEGTACDDGNPFTNNDMYNDDCECVGVPCSGPDCDSPLASYVPYEECGATNIIDNRPQHQWTSCTKQPSPNTNRPNSHWIQYDMGEDLLVVGSHIWNYNVAGKTNKGFANVAIDYSTDGVSWTELGTYNWPYAQGEPMYTGFIGPDFMGVEARYILITSLDNDNDCKGLGKVAFTTVKCPQAGTPCDDGDPATANDKYDDNCNCSGSGLEENECDEQIIALGDSTLTKDKYSAIQSVNSISKVTNDKATSLLGGDFVELNPGFETQPNAVFVAAIDDCVQALLGASTRLRYLIHKKQNDREKAQAEKLYLSLSEDETVVNIHYYLDKPGQARIELLKSNGEKSVLIDHKFRNNGYYTKRVLAKNLAAGVTVRLVSEGGTKQVRRAQPVAKQ